MSFRGTARRLIDHFPAALARLGLVDRDPATDTNGYKPVSDFDPRGSTMLTTL
jgi:hypothetical protein